MQGIDPVHGDGGLRRQGVERCAPTPQLIHEIGNRGAVGQLYGQLADAQNVTVSGKEEGGD